MVFRFRNYSARRKSLFLILSVLIICGITYGGYKYYLYHQSQLLRKARALEGIAEYVEAIGVLKEYLIKKPKDLQAKLYLAHLYSCQGNYPKCLEILDKVEVEAARTGNDRLKRRVVSSKRYHLCLFAWELSDSVELMMAQEDYKKARELSKQTWDIWDSWIFSMAMDTLVPMEKADEFTFNYYIAPVVSDWALTYWLEGDYRQAEEVMDYALILTRSNELRRKFPAWIRKDFASKLDELASKEFDKENYALARVHWSGAIESYEAVGVALGVDDLKIPRLMYNRALTYLNEGKYSRWRKALSQLRSEFPEYQPQKIKAMIKDAKAASMWQGEEAICRKASKAFDDKRWSEARAYYREAMNYLLKSGIKEDHEEICRLNFNIAIAYYNDFKYNEAKEILEKLKTTRPTYNNERIKELLAELKEMGY